MQDLDVNQQLAIADVIDLNKRLVAVTGPAGSGKTTIIKTACDKLSDAAVSFALAAPTGKAARRITEATGYKATTLHRLLEYTHPGQPDPETGEVSQTSEPKRDRNTPLSQQVIIVDEYAMINTVLHRNLVSALGPNSVLRCFGDLAQLPPIEDADLKTVDETPFERVLKMKHTHKLETVYRQAEGSDLLTAANQIRLGRAPRMGLNFRFKMTDNPVDVLMDHVVQSGIDYKSIKNQIITPQKKSWVGTHALNTTLQALLNPTMDMGLELPRHRWDIRFDTRKRPIPTFISVGDKVVCTENSYELRNYEERFAQWDDKEDKPVLGTYIPTPDNKQMLNGETGVVVAISPIGALEIDFGDRVVEVPHEYSEFHKDHFITIDPRKRLDLAYALTTHKTQGSEYENVCYVMNKSTWYMANRKNFYTGITRARKNAFVITDQKAWARSLGNAG